MTKPKETYRVFRTVEGTACDLLCRNPPDSKYGGKDNLSFSFRDPYDEHPGEPVDFDDLEEAKKWTPVDGKIFNAYGACVFVNTPTPTPDK